MGRVLLVTLLLAILGLLGWIVCDSWSDRSLDPRTGTTENGEVPTRTEPRTGETPPSTDPRRDVATSTDHGPVADPVADPDAGGPAPGYVLAGRVFERAPTGGTQPRSGVRVVLGYPASYGARTLQALAETSSDADGTFRFERPGDERSGDLLLEAQADGLHTDDWLQVWPEPGDRIAGLDLTLVPVVDGITGVVVDGDDTPVAAATVQVRRDGSWRGRRAGPHPRTAYRPKHAQRTTTDARGAFALDPLPAAGPWTFHAQEGRRGGATEVGTLERGMAPVRIRIAARERPTGPRVFGHVVGPDGAGVDGATVYALAGGEQRVTTDADGAFEVVLARGSEQVHLTVGADGYGFLHQDLAEVTTDVGPLLLRITPELRIAGVLLDTDDRPIPGARIRIDGEPEFLSNSVPPATSLQLLGSKFAVTDDVGRFSFDKLPSGSFRVTWQQRDAPTGGAAATVAAGTEDLQLRAGVVQGPQVAWEVMVRDRLSGLPLEDASVSISRVLRMAYGTGAEGVRYASTDRDGLALLAIAAPATPAEYEIEAGQPGYAAVELEAAEYGTGLHRATLELLPERSLQVRVVDASGAAVPQASLAIYVDGRSLAIRTGSGGAQSPVHADADGRAWLHGLPARSVTLRGWTESASTELVVDLSAEREHEVELVLRGR